MNERLDDVIARARSVRARYAELERATYAECVRQALASTG